MATSRLCLVIIEEDDTPPPLVLDERDLAIMESFDDGVGW